MSKLKVPSLQHLARNWRSDPQRVKRALVELVRNSPTFSYDALFGAVRDMLVLGVPYEQIEKGIKRIKREDLRDNLLSVLPLIHKHFSDIAPTFVQSVARRYYPVGRNLMVPFDPPMIYGLDGQIHFPWFSFWRSNPLTDERLSLFVSIVEDVLLQDPDLENARFQILDFSAPAPKEPRELRVIEAAEILRISPERKIEMLTIFADGYSMAETELSSASKPDSESTSKSAEEGTRDEHPDLFDRDR
jgi:hypothetical protein